MFNYINILKGNLHLIGKVTIYLTNVALTLLLLNRWIVSGHFPLSNLYESLIFLSWSFTTIFFVASLTLPKTILPIIGSSIAPITLLTCCFAFFCVPPELQKAQPLVPALQSNWLIMHVSVMILSYASLLLGSLFALALLIAVRFFNTREVFLSTHSNDTMSSTPYFPPKYFSYGNLTQLFAKRSPYVLRREVLHYQEDSRIKDCAKDLRSFAKKDEVVHQRRRRCAGVSDAPTGRSSAQAEFVHSETMQNKKIQNQKRNYKERSTTYPTEASLAAAFDSNVVNDTASLMYAVPQTGKKVQVTEVNYEYSLGSTPSSACITSLCTNQRSKDRKLTLINSASSFFWLPLINTCSLLLDRRSTKNLPKKMHFVKKDNRQNENVLFFGKKNIMQVNLLDDLSYRFISFGFAFLTLGIISGAVWANFAWGSYWSWDPKETWAFITWLTYAIYLHLRISKGWFGEQSAFVAIFGFFIVWFCYLGVNLFGKGLHSYAFV